MPRRKFLLNEVLDILEKLTILYGLVLIGWWFFDKNAFWRWAFYGIGFLALFVILAISIKLWLKRSRAGRVKRYRSDRELLLILKAMRPGEFEEYIADLFSKMGFKTKKIGGAYDGGIDVIAEKGGQKHYIQCKKYITQTVPVGAIRDFYGAITDHLANGKSYFITTNKFTLEAEKFAEDKPIELIDGQKLIRYIKLVKKNNAKT